jgi:hypothetical protein
MGGVLTSPALVRCVIGMPHGLVHFMCGVR